MLTILMSKPHNFHHLSRYLRFIESCKELNASICIKTKLNPDGVYMEQHHICPKSSDLFPEFSNLKENEWNSVNLTARQHYLAHFMLFKAYKGKQTYAFNCMCNQRNNKNTKRYYKINSRLYESLKKSIASQSHPNTGTAVYTDGHGNNMRLSVNDHRVLSGELVSCTKGRVGSMLGKKHTEDTIKKLKGMKKTPEHIAKISKSKLGQARSEAAKQATSNTLKGRIFSQEHLKNLALSSRKTKTCIHCGKLSDPGNHAKNHGDRCKSYTTVVALNSHM